MKNKYCQSCGMPLVRDSKHGGTEADGRQSTQYCSHCYELGQFKQPELTVTQMQALVKAKLCEMGFPAVLAWFFARGIPKLHRWRSVN